MVTIPISAAFIGAAFSRGEALSRGRPQFQCGYQRVWHLLEEIRQLFLRNRFGQQ